MMNEIGLSTIRQLNEMAIAAGRERQSKQTGFIHYFYHENDQELHHTIPVFENLLFVLALLKSKTSEQMSEAKELLEKILNFQNFEGGFPTYIHEYPECKDRCIGVQLLPIFYYILNDFQSILGVELKQKIVTAVKKLISFSELMHEQQAYSYLFGVKFAASLQSFGTYFGEFTLEKKGKQLLDEYKNQGIQLCWFSPHSIAELCVALQLVEPDLLESSWKEFSQHLINSWHAITKCYVGPAVRVHQQKNEPQPTLYDLFLGYLSDGFSPRATEDAAFHLQAALIRPTENRLSAPNFPLVTKGNLNGISWLIYQQKDFAYSLVDAKTYIPAAQHYTLHPFYLVWGYSDSVHTFVCQAGNFDTFNFANDHQNIKLETTLAPTCELEDREKAREISFYFDIEPDLTIQVAGEKSTTFHLLDEVTITTPQIKISLQFSLEKGNGDFVGHLMRGNRPSQLKVKGNDRFNAYDWQVFLRTLRREDTCHLKARLRIDTCG